jgi:hypothetical protein
VLSLTIPRFENEEQEAQWWYDHREELDDDFLQAMRDGRAKLASETEHGRRVMRAARRACAAAEAAKAFIACASEQDRDRFHQLAVKAGLDDQTYIQQVLLNALAGAESLAA